MFSITNYFSPNRPEERKLRSAYWGVSLSLFQYVFAVLFYPGYMRPYYEKYPLMFLLAAMAINFGALYIYYIHNDNGKYEIEKYLKTETKLQQKIAMVIGALFWLLGVLSVLLPIDYVNKHM